MWPSVRFDIFPARTCTAATALLRMLMAKRIRPASQGAAASQSETRVPKDDERRDPLSETRPTLQLLATIISKGFQGLSVLLGAVVAAATVSTALLFSTLSSPTCFQMQPIATSLSVLSVPASAIPVGVGTVCATQLTSGEGYYLFVASTVLVALTFVANLSIGKMGHHISLHSG